MRLNPLGIVCWIIRPINVMTSTVSCSVRSVRGVGRIRARYLTARLPNPPVRPVRETFASYGSRQRGVYRKLPFRQLHGTFTVVSLRVRWVPLYHFPTLSLRAFAMYAVFPHSDYYAQFDCLWGLGVSYEFPHSYSPPSLTSLTGSPVFTAQDSKQNAVGGVFLR